MSLEIAWKQNILVTDFQLLKSLLVVFGFGLQAIICEFSRQNICSVAQVMLKQETSLSQHNKRKYRVQNGIYIIYIFFKLN